MLTMNEETLLHGVSLVSGENISIYFFLIYFTVSVTINHYPGPILFFILLLIFFTLSLSLSQRFY